MTELYQEISSIDPYWSIGLVLAGFFALKPALALWLITLPFQIIKELVLGEKEPSQWEQYGFRSPTPQPAYSLSKSAGRAANSADSLFARALSATWKLVSGFGFLLGFVSGLISLGQFLGLLPATIAG